MKKSLIILSVCLIVLGLMVTALAYFSFTPFDTENQKTYEITEAFQNIHIDVDTTDVTFLPSSDGTCKVVFREEPRLFHRVSVQNGTLTIERIDARQWYEQMFPFTNLSADIYLPQNQYGTLLYESDTGDLEMPAGFLFSLAELETDTGNILWRSDVTENLSISVDTGDITLSGSHVGSMDLESDTGDVLLSETLAEHFISVETNTGNVAFVNADGETIHVETDTGDVTGTLLTEKLFRGESDTGRVRIPWDTRGGDCIVFTDTGDIKLSVAK